MELRQLKFMREILLKLVGSKVDINCGNGAIYRGEVTELKDGIAVLRDEEGRVSYLAIDKIAAVTEISDAASRPGFIS